jgi:hypothetical protein
MPDLPPFVYPPFHRTEEILCQRPYKFITPPVQIYLFWMSLYQKTGIRHENQAHQALFRPLKLDFVPAERSPQHLGVSILGYEGEGRRNEVACASEKREAERARLERKPQRR